MSDTFEFDSFQKTLAGHRGMIKPALMNQKIMAGIGNVYSDEILFQAKIHPKAKIPDLRERDLKKIYEKIKSVLKTAIECEAEPNQFPDSYIIAKRGKDDASCPGCGGKLQNIKVS